MTRRSPAVPLIVANWKMQLGIEESQQRLMALKDRVKLIKGRQQTVVCPSLTSLPSLKKLLRGSSIELGAQNVFWDERGAFTGEISPLDLLEAGVKYVIIGHSERRKILGETDEMISRKVCISLRHGLIPILCVGETAHERNEGRQDLVVAQQIEMALRTAPPPTGDGRFYIAYEPIWAIGTGEAASSEDAAAMLRVIHQTLIERYTENQVSQGYRILYGGSVDAENVSTYVQASLYHGALIGGASLEPEKLASIIEHIIKEFNT